MNGTLQIDEIKKMCKEILRRLGHTYTYVDINDNEPDSTECVYSEYGLDIKAYDLPGYNYEDQFTGELCYQPSEDMGDIKISYNGYTVFDISKEIYKKGIWEDILKEVYNKIEIIIAQRFEKEKKDKYYLYLFKNVILPLQYKGVYQVNGSIELKHYSSLSARVNNCGTYEDNKNYVVIKDGQVVLHIVDEGVSTYVSSYIPGTWEHELEQYLAEWNTKPLEIDNTEGLEYIRQLKKLK